MNRGICRTDKKWVHVMRVNFLLSIGLLLAAGCSSMSPFATTAHRPVPIAAQIANNTSGAMGRSAPAQLLPSGVGSQQQFTQTGPNSYTQGLSNPENPFLAGLLSATESISNALTIEPRVIPAKDPTSLAVQPANVGADLHFHAALVYESQQNIPGAISHFQQALDTSPHDPKILVGFGHLFDRQGDLHRAEGLYQLALETNPDNCAALNALGICYAKQGNLDAALAHLHRATQLQPQNARYKNNMANVLTDAGRTDEAYAQLVSVHGEAGAHYNLGYLLLQQGKQDEARRELGLALRANPYLEQAHQMLSSLEPNSAPVQPTSGKFAAPGRYSVSQPYNPRVANPTAATREFGIPSFDQKSLAGPHSLPPL